MKFFPCEQGAHLFFLHQGPFTSLAATVSVSILSTVETSCTTNQQQIAMIDLEGYSWSTCSKQPPLADCRISIVNKLDRQWRQQRVLLTTRSTCRGEKSGVVDKVTEGSICIFIEKNMEMPTFPYNAVRDRWKKASMPKTSSTRPVISTQYRLVTDRQTNTR